MLAYRPLQRIVSRGQCRCQPPRRDFLLPRPPKWNGWLLCRSFPHCKRQKPEEMHKTLEEAHPHWRWPGSFSAGRWFRPSERKRRKRRRATKLAGPFGKRSSAKLPKLSSGPWRRSPFRLMHSNKAGLKHRRRGSVQYWTAPKPARMQHTVRDKAMTLSEKSHDSEQGLRWLAWERKNRLKDRIAEKRMTLVFVLVGVILLILILYAVRQVSDEKGPTVACQWRTDPLRYCLECGKSLKPA
jgi:hypothetical protein